MGRSNTVTVTVSAPKRRSILELYVSPQSGVAPLTIYLIAYLYDQDGITPLPGRTIKFYDTTGRLIGSATTDSSGEAFISHTISQAGTYSFYAEWEGDEMYEGCEEYKEYIKGDIYENW